MTQRSLLAFALSLALVLSSVSAALINPYTNTGTDLNPFCDSPLTLTSKVEDVLDGEDEPLDFQHTSFKINNENGDSIPLFIREPADGSGWKWLVYSDNKFSEVLEYTCPGTVTDTLVKVFRDILIVKASDGTRKACVFRPDPADSTNFALTTKALAAIPSDIVIGDIVVFSPYYVEKAETEHKLFVLVNDGDTSSIYSYDLLESEPIPAVS